MPRAATSVATRTLTYPSLKSARVRVRAPWVMPPCSASAFAPASRSCSATRSAPSWVRTKMMVRPLREAMAAVTGALSLGFTIRMWWDMVVTAPCAASTSWETGSVR